MRGSASRSGSARTSRRARQFSSARRSNRNGDGRPCYRPSSRFSKSAQKRQGEIMYIAMNRFRVVKDQAKAFEQLWATRESYLHEMKGFVEFHLLKGPEKEDHQLYSSHTLWETYEDFLA